VNSRVNLSAGHVRAFIPIVLAQRLRQRFSGFSGAGGLGNTLPPITCGRAALGDGQIEVEST
jgi:hypothetical protein